MTHFARYYASWIAPERDCRDGSGVARGAEPCGSSGRWRPLHCDRPRAGAAVDCAPGDPVPWKVAIPVTAMEPGTDFRPGTATLRGFGTADDHD
ncbi:hypothetical protein ACFWNT_23810 [Streptomyces sp. NPDC058409]|uniref:hypothetical protein n=1 Tax=Streptomyces sp. NPDC058409 TaxID=3346484 RepID=UPI00365DCB14